jgi:acetylornithine deacetylase/succinyl-diaminopimelate desuccinylase-like protein
VAHEKDEYIKIDDLLLNLKIYAYVIQDLIK